MLLSQNSAISPAHPSNLNSSLQIWRPLAIGPQIAFSFSDHQLRDLQADSEKNTFLKVKNGKGKFLLVSGKFIVLNTFSKYFFWNILL